MSPVVVAALVALNLVVIFLLLAVPLGVRTIVLKARIAAPRVRIWQALFRSARMPAGRAKSVARKLAGRRRWRWSA